MAAFTAPPIPVSASLTSWRAELIFGGIDQAGPSFEGRVFLNNPDADETTPRTPEMGYVGAFHVYGYGTPAPPAVAEKRQAQRPGAVAPIEKRLRAPEVTFRAALDKSDEVTVTVVPVPTDPGGAIPDRPFERVEIMFDAPE